MKHVHRTVVDKFSKTNQSFQFTRRNSQAEFDKTIHEGASKKKWKNRDEHEEAIEIKADINYQLAINGFVRR